MSSGGILLTRQQPKTAHVAIISALLDLDTATSEALGEVASTEELIALCAVVDDHLAKTSTPDFYLDHARSWARAVVIYGAALADGETDNVPADVVAALLITTTVGRPPRECFPREHLSTSPDHGADYLLLGEDQVRRAAAVGTPASKGVSWWVPIRLADWVREG